MLIVQITLLQNKEHLKNCVAKKEAPAEEAQDASSRIEVRNASKLADQTVFLVIPSPFTMDASHTMLSPVKFCEERLMGRKNADRKTQDACDDTSNLNDLQVRYRLRTLVELAIDIGRRRGMFQSLSSSRGGKFNIKPSEEVER